MANDNTPAVSPLQMHAELAAALLRAIADPGNCPQVGNDRAERSISEWSRDAVMKTLVDDGWIVPGVPPCRQVLADARQLHDEIVLTKLVARFFRVIILGAVIIPDTPAAMDWLRDYIDGTHTVHGPLGRPMLWPDRLPAVTALLRDWGFQPTPTQPPYVSMRPGGKMLDLEMPEPGAPDPRMVEPIDPDVEMRMGSLLDGITQGVTCQAVDRTTAIRAMVAAYKSSLGVTIHERQAEALKQLRDHQEQADPDGARVTVSREAVDIVLEYFNGAIWNGS